MGKIFSILLVIVGVPLILCAGEADVLQVSVSSQGNGYYRFEVTIAHGDTGWKHYADKWEVLDAAGNILATRVLLHPHVEEQPFTRSLGNVKIAKALRKITIRAHDLVHGYGGKSKTVVLSP